MTEEAAKRRKEYLKKYRRTHKEEAKAYTRAWRAAHPDKVAVYNARYLAKKAATQAEAETAAAVQE